MSIHVLCPYKSQFITDVSSEINLLWSHLNQTICFPNSRRKSFSNYTQVNIKDKFASSLTKDTILKHAVEWKYTPTVLNSVPDRREWSASRPCPFIHRRSHTLFFNRRRLAPELGWALRGKEKSVAHAENRKLISAITNRILVTIASFTWFVEA